MHAACGHLTSALAAWRRATAFMVPDERMRNVMGLSRVCRAVRVAKDPEAAAAAAVRLTAGRPGTFAVRARRRDKRFPDGLHHPVEARGLARKRRLHDRARQFARGCEAVRRAEQDRDH